MHDLVLAQEELGVTLQLVSEVLEGAGPDVLERNDVVVFIVLKRCLDLFDKRLFAGAAFSLDFSECNNLRSLVLWHI